MNFQAIFKSKVIRFILLSAACAIIAYWLVEKQRHKENKMFTAHHLEKLDSSENEFQKMA